MTVLYFKIGHLGRWAYGHLMPDRDVLPDGQTIWGKYSASLRCGTEHCYIVGWIQMNQDEVVGHVTHPHFYIYCLSVAMWASMRFRSSTVIGSVGRHTRSLAKPRVLMAYLVEAV